MQINIAKLLTVKSIVTIIFSIVYCYLAIVKIVDADQFHTIFLMITSFYFGTQLEKHNKNSQE